MGTTSGYLYQIDYQKQSIIGIFRVHAGAIRAIEVNSTYCITGSDDNTVKIWPLNFKEAVST